MSNMDGHKLIGSNDSSIENPEDDLFAIGNYIKGFSKFINNCVTPMTISVQGDWGSGKTSIMNMVMQSLDKQKVETVWFNTWQYSQFNLDDELPILLMSKLIKALKPDNASTSERLKTIFKAIGSVSARAGVSALGYYLGEVAATNVEEIAGKLIGGENDVVDAVNSLKTEFSKCVKDKLESEGKERLVIFIDDLDRLNPGKAVELLEVLKLFLDCEKCVFVLAIDYEVVSAGVKEKYGNLLGEDKGKSFFDKIIQVPFKVPVAHYKVENFVNEMMSQMGIETAGSSNEDYVRMIEMSVGCNPRSMKRLFNAYLLLSYISEQMDEIKLKLHDENEGSWYRKILFATLCCQLAYEDLYNFIVSNADHALSYKNLKLMENPANYIMSESNTGSDDTDVEQSAFLVSLQNAFRHQDEDYISGLAQFVGIFADVADKNSDGILDDAEAGLIKEIFSFSAITAVSDEGTTPKISRIEVSDFIFNPKWNNTQNGLEEITSIIKEQFGNCEGTIFKYTSGGNCTLEYDFDAADPSNSGKYQDTPLHSIWIEERTKGFSVGFSFDSNRKEKIKEMLPDVIGVAAAESLKYTDGKDGMTFYFRILVSNSADQGHDHDINVIRNLIGRIKGIR